MYKESDILFESGEYWVMINKKTSSYEVYKIGITHSTRCASVGISLGMERVKQEITRRQELDSKLYNLVAINEKSGEETLLTRYPMTHAECCVMKSKFSYHKARRIQLQEVKQEICHETN